MKVADMNDSAFVTEMGWKAVGGGIEEHWDWRDRNGMQKSEFTDRAEEIADWCEENIGEEGKDWFIIEEQCKVGSYNIMRGEFPIRFRISVFFRERRTLALFKIVHDNGEILVDQPKS